MPDAHSTKAWTKITLAECVEEIAQRVDNPTESGFERFVGLEHIETGDISIRSWGSTDDVTSSMKVFKAGDVIVARRNVYLRRAARAGFDGVCSGDGIVLRAKSEVCLPELLTFLLNTASFWNYVTSQADGTMSKRITVKRLLSYELALPPIAEQPHLTNALASGEHVVESLLELGQSLRIAQAAAFSDIVSRHGPKPSQLGDVLLRSPQNGCSAPPASAPTGHWVLALSAISRWGYRPGELKPVERSRAMESATIAKGDLVLSRSNTRELVGLPAVFSEDRTDVSYPDTMMRLIVDPDRVDARYLELCLRAPECRRQVQSFAAGTSSSMKKINASNLKKVMVPVIAPDRQAIVLHEIGGISRLIGDTDARLAEAKCLRGRLAERVFVMNANTP